MKCIAEVKDLKIMKHRSCGRRAVGRFGPMRDPLCTQHAKAEVRWLRKRLEKLEDACRKAGVSLPSSDPPKSGHAE